MKYFDAILRFMWGTHFFAFGINKIIVFQKVPATNAFAQQVIDSFYATDYLMQAVGVFQILTGFLILVNRAFPLAILVAFPISLNIALFTVFTSNYSTSAIATGAMVFFANVYFIVCNRVKYLPLLNIMGGVPGYKQAEL